MVATKKMSVNWTVRIYFLLISLASFIAFVVLYTTAIYATAKYYIMTDQEYQLKNYRRNIENCTNEKYIQDKPIMPTAEEIAECEKKQIENSTIERKLTFKENVITWTLRWTILLLVFLIHFPIFLKINKES